jgi:hypothetical protein
MDGLAQGANVRPGSAGSPQQLRGGQWSPRSPIFFFNPMPSSFLSQVFAQKLTGLWIQESDL